MFRAMIDKGQVLVWGKWVIKFVQGGETRELLRGCNKAAVLADVMG